MRVTPFAALSPLILLVSRPALGDGGAATDSYEGIAAQRFVDVHALADLYVQGNLGTPPSQTNSLRAFDTHANVPAVGLVRLTVARLPEPLGFRFDVGAGDFADGYLRYDPAGTDYPLLSRALSYVEQAFVTVKLPVGPGERMLYVDAGKFGTPVGLEDNEALTDWNYSRSLLYLLAEPSYHTGVRATYALVPTVAASLFWVNGWDANILDGSGMRTFAAAVTWTPSPGLEIVADYLGGADRALTRLSDPTLHARNVVDAYVQYDVGKHVSLACTGDYGRDASSGGVTWAGIGGYVRYSPRDWLAWSARGEHYDDSSGFTSGTRQRLAELTATLELRRRVGIVSVIGRVEYRRDQSDVRSFQSAAGPSTHQDTAGVAILTAF